MRYFITYDLVDKETYNYERLYNLLNRLNAVMITESTYAINFSESRETLFNLIKSHMNKDDKLLIGIFPLGFNSQNIDSVKKIKDLLK